MHISSLKDRIIKNKDIDRSRSRDQSKQKQIEIHSKTSFLQQSFQKLRSLIPQKNYQNQYNNEKQYNQYHNKNQTQQQINKNQNSIMDFQKKKQFQIIEQYPSVDLSRIFQQIHLPEIDLQIDFTMPTPTNKYGSNINLVNKKNEITQHSKKWQIIVKQYINDYELIDIYRTDYQKHRYNKSMISYCDDHPNGLKPVISRSYFKLWEILSSSKLLDQYKGKQINIANIAEGPGGFIHSLINFRNKQNSAENTQTWWKDRYFAITLKQSSPDCNHLDWEFPKSKEYFNNLKSDGYCNITLSYGKKDGNIMNLENIEYFIIYDVHDQKCELITADGGIDVNSDQECELQEIFNVRLFFAEIVLALSIQSLGGTFVMKIYDSIYDITIDLLILLNHFYTEVQIVKPHTSRPASSERYLICGGFRGISKQYLNKIKQTLQQWGQVETNSDYLKNDRFIQRIFKANVSQEFQQQIKKFNEDCINKQINKIDFGLEMIRKVQFLNQQEANNLIIKRKDEQFEKAKKWCQNHKINYLGNLEISQLTTEQFKVLNN